MRKYPRYSYECSAARYTNGDERYRAIGAAQSAGRRAIVDAGHTHSSTEVKSEQPGGKLRSRPAGQPGEMENGGLSSASRIVYVARR